MKTKLKNKLPFFIGFCVSAAAACAFLAGARIQEVLTGLLALLVLASVKEGL